MTGESDSLVANPLVVVQPIDGGSVLMDVATGDCFELNQIGAEIWTLFAEGRSQASIVAALVSSYDIRPEAVESDVRALLADLKRHGLVAPRP